MPTKQPQGWTGCGWPATTNPSSKGGGRERERNKAEDEDAEASGTRGTQRHANPRHPTQFLSLMIPVADCCFIGENHKLEKVSTKVPSLNFFNILLRFVIIRFFCFFLFSFLVTFVIEEVQGGLR